MTDIWAPPAGGNDMSDSPGLRSPPAGRRSGDGGAPRGGGDADPLSSAVLRQFAGTQWPGPAWLGCGFGTDVPQADAGSTSGTSSHFLSPRTASATYSANSCIGTEAPVPMPMPPSAFGGGRGDGNAAMRAAAARLADPAAWAPRGGERAHQTMPSVSLTMGAVTGGIASQSDPSTEFQAPGLQRRASDSNAGIIGTGTRATDMRACAPPPPYLPVLSPPLRLPTPGPQTARMLARPALCPAQLASPCNAPSGCRLKSIIDAVPANMASLAAVLLNTAPGFTPGLPGLTKLVSTLSKEGQWAKALALFDAAPLTGLPVDTTLTNAAIAAAGRGGDAARARALFAELPARGLPANSGTHRALMVALVRSGQPLAAVEVRPSGLMSGLTPVLMPALMSGERLLYPAAHVGKPPRIRNNLIISGVQAFLEAHRQHLSVEGATVMALLNAAAASHWPLAEELLRTAVSSSHVFASLDALPPPPTDTDGDAAALTARLRSHRLAAAAAPPPPQPPQPPPPGGALLCRRAT